MQTELKNNNTFNLREKGLSQWDKMQLCREKTSMACREAVSGAEGMKAFLQTLSRFEKYSLGNVFLIHRQKPNATKVKEYGKWAEEGYHISKGAKGIMILEPKNDGDNPGYNVKSVFDISDLVKPPQIPQVSHDLKAIISALIEQSGFKLVIPAEYPKDKPPKAYFDPLKNTIFAEKSSDKEGLFFAISKALAHGLMSQAIDNYRVSENDLAASCIAYTLSCKYGFFENLDIPDFDENIKENFASHDDAGIKTELSIVHVFVREITELARETLVREARSKDEPKKQNTQKKNQVKEEHEKSR